MADIVNKTKTTSTGSSGFGIGRGSSGFNALSQGMASYRQTQAEPGDDTLAAYLDDLERQGYELAEQQTDTQKTYTERVNQFLKGELFDVPKATMEAMEANIDASYGPEIADLRKRGVELRNVIRDQGVESLNKLKEIRAQSERSFSMMADDERQKLLDTAASSGRSPVDPALLRDFAASLGREFSNVQSGLIDAERNIADTTSNRIMGLAKEQTAGEDVLNANRAALKAGQRFSLQTGLPLQQIQTGAAATQLANALSTQGLANQMATLGGIQGVTSPLTQGRMAQPTTTQTQNGSVLGTLGGILSGGASIAGALI